MTGSRIDISSERDIVSARQLARSNAQVLGFGAVDQSRIATAVSELARNVVRYATEGKGWITVRTVDSPDGRRGLEIVVEDEGPGIENPDAALEPGYTTGRGMGLGLSGTRRLMDEMLLDSEVGRGTTVTIRKWKR